MYAFQRFVMLVVVSLMAFGILLVGAAAVASADGDIEVNNQSYDDPESVDRHLTILNSSYHGEREEATITLLADRPMDVRIADAGQFAEGSGEVTTREIELIPDQPKTVRLSVTEVSGQVGLSIESPHTLYAHIIEAEDHLFYEDPDWGIVQIAGVMGGSGVLAAITLDVIRRKWGGRTEVSRIA